MVGAAEPARRDYTGVMTDSRRWAEFRPRDGDIVVCTPPKSGTTWTQAILALLISGDPDVNADPSMRSPWIDISIRDMAGVVERLEAQTHRRQVKTHTPFDGIPMWRELRYITAYRHPIDVYFSYRKHAHNQVRGRDLGYFPESYFNEDPAVGFASFVRDEGRDGTTLQSVAHHYLCTLAREPRENLLRMHYADMLCDPDGAFLRVADHVGIHHRPEVMASLMAAARFENMKANASRFAPGAGRDNWHSDAGFFDSASSGKWKGVLGDQDLATYDARINEMLDPQQRHWLEWGNVSA